MRERADGTRRHRSGKQRGRARRRGGLRRLAEVGPAVGGGEAAPKTVQGTIA